MSSKFGAINLGLKKPGTEALRVEKPASLIRTILALLFGSLSLVKPANFIVTDLDVERQGELL